MQPHADHNLLVLAAGYATRMGTMARHRPKPLLDVAGRPMMDWVMERLGAIDGLARCAVVTNARFLRQFAAWRARYLAGAGRAVREVDLIDNGSRSRATRRGAIADLQFALEAGGLWDRDLVVVGGDNLFEQPPRRFVEFARGKPAAIGTYDVGSPDEVRRFASIATDRRGRITAFEEKPAAPSGTVAGIALFWFRSDVLPRVAEYLAAGHNPDQAGHLIEWLRGRVETYGCAIEGRWFDVGSPQSLAAADRYFRGPGGAGDSGCGAGGSRP